MKAYAIRANVEIIDEVIEFFWPRKAFTLIFIHGFNLLINHSSKWNEHIFGRSKNIGCVDRTHVPFVEIKALDRRGRDADPDALLRRDGLLEAA